MDCSAVVLNKLILERNLDVWAKLKLAFLDNAYASVYSAISRHYDKYSTIPSFEELQLEVREGITQKTIGLIKLIDEPDISAEVALDALIDQYTQNQTISLLDKFVDKLTVYDSNEIKENLASIVIALDEKTLTSEGVYNMSEIMIFRDYEQLQRDRVMLGINNSFDSELNGVARQELILLGGERGAGKSIVSSNLVVNQYEAGNCCVIFTIEMIAQEVFERNLAIQAGVPYMSLKKNNLTQDDLLKVIKTRAEQFLDADELVLDYLSHRDRFKFEHDLVRNKVLKPDNQIIIVDDRSLTLTSIDLHIGKLKARFGDKLKLVVVDYLNQIVEEGSSQYDWQPQIIKSKKLKDYARKHDVTIFSPYQIDASGEARFAKGILDAADIALLMKSHDKEAGAIGFETTKIRGGPPLKFTSPINWETLRISSESIDAPVADKKERVKKAKNVVDDSSSDIPWNV